MILIYFVQNLSRFFFIVLSQNGNGQRSLAQISNYADTVKATLQKPFIDLLEVRVAGECSRARECVIFGSAMRQCRSRWTRKENLVVSWTTAATYRT